LALLVRGELGVAQNPGSGIAAGPRDQCRRPCAEEIDPVERTVLFIEADRAAPDLVLADVVSVKVKVERRFELAGMRAAAWELALSPTRQELLVDREEVPPADGDALGVGLEIRPPAHEVEVGPIRSVAVQQDDLLEPVIGQALRDVQNLIDVVLVMG